MTGCPLTEINPDPAIKLAIGSGLVNGISLISSIVSLRSKISELRLKIKNSLQLDVSGLPYQPTPQQHRLLKYSFSFRIYMLMVINILGLSSVITYSIITAGDPKLLPDDLACYSIVALWVAIGTAVVALVVVSDILLYFLRLHKAVDEIH
jgi:hypothetical protein